MRAIASVHTQAAGRARPGQEQPFSRARAVDKEDCAHPHKCTERSILRFRGSLSDFMVGSSPLQSRSATRLVAIEG
jgi:hypothetical protein